MTGSKYIRWFRDLRSSEVYLVDGFSTVSNDLIQLGVTGDPAELMYLFEEERR